MNILYYSNFCQHSKNLLNTLARSNISNGFYYVCIDKRENISGSTIIILENGNKIPLPKIIQKVPSLLLSNHGNRVLTGDEILNYINLTNQQSHQQNNTQLDDPEPFFLSYNNYDNICSDKYSFLDSTDDDMSAKGNGGVRQMHNYVDMNLNPLIATPPENYTPDKIGDGASEMDKYMAQREKDIPKMKMPYT